MFERLLWHSPAYIPIAIGASLLIVAAVLWVYWPVMSRARGVTRWLLPSLRGIALVVLAISLIRPVIVRPRTPAERGAIVLLIDRSPSMGVVDTGRTPSQLVALAQAMQMLPRGIRPKSAARLEQAPDTLRDIVNDLYETRGQLDYARIARPAGGFPDTDSAEQRLTEISQRAGSLADELSDFPKLNRLLQKLADLSTNDAAPSESWTRDVSALNDSITEAIAQAQTASDNDLYRSNDTVREACDELSSMSRLAILDRALAGSPNGVLSQLMSQATVFGLAFADNVQSIPLEDNRGPLKSLPLEPGGTRTDLTGALRAVREKMQGQPVQAVVLCSDGGNVGPEPGLTGVLANSSAPVFTINCAGPVRKDLSLLRISAPASPFIGQSATIRADVRGVGFRGASIDVVLATEGKRLTKEITIKDEHPVTVEFPMRFDHPGDQSITVSIPKRTGETTLANNSISRSINVIAEKVKVLAITSWPGWDFQHLVKTLRDSPFIDLREQILSGNGAKWTASPEQILQSDVVLLSDIRADVLSREQSAAIGKLVSERGGSVIVIPGDPKNLAELDALPGMSALLPFSDVQDAAWRVWPGEDPYFHLDTAPGTRNSDALRLTDEPADNAEKWAALPGMYRFMPVTDPRDDVRPLLVERDSELPVLTQMRVGTGRSFFFGARETWRWRAVDDAKDQERFWLQLVRFAARPRASGPEMQITQETPPELANVAGDEPRLRRIASATGGEMLRVDDLADLPGKIRDAGEKLPAFFEYPLWDSGYLFAFVVGCFILEWALRKRSGLT